MQDLEKDINYRPETTVFSNNGRTVLVVGSEMVSEKFIAVIDACLSLVAGDGDHGVNSIIFQPDPIPRMVPEDAGDETRTVGVMADACMHAGAITINMPETMGQSFETTSEKENYSIYGIWWHNMILNVLHEALHCSQLACDAKPEKWMADFLTNHEGFADDIEKEATKVADDLCKALGRQYDIEPPVWTEETYFAEEVLKIYAGDDGEDKKTIQWLNDRVFVWAEKDGEPCPLTSFREHLHRLSGDDVEDEAWHAKVMPLALDKSAAAPETAVEETAVATPAPAPETVVVAETPVATVADTGYDPDQEPGQDTVADDMSGILMAAAQVGAMDIMATGAMPSIPTTGEEVTLDSLFTAPSPAPRPTPGVVQQPTVAGAIQQEYGATPPVATQDNTFIVNPDAPAPAMMPATATPQPQAMNATQTTPALQQLQNLNLDPAVVRDTVYSVLTKLQDHIFRHCQLRAGQQDPTEDVRTPYEYADAVTKMPVQLTPQEAQVVFACDGQDEMGRWCPNRPTNDGRLYGQVSSKQGLPMYKIHINFNGVHLIRTLSPGNPNSRDGANNLKRNAQAVRTGQRIAYVFEGDDVLKQANPGIALKAKCVNGQWEVING